jgi:hypothetical protein
LARRLDDELRFDQRFVALHIDDDGVAGPATLLHHLGQPVGTRRMVAARHQRGHSCASAAAPDFRMIGRHPDLFGTRQARAFGDTHHHRLAAEIEQRLGRQARRRVARRNNDLEGRRSLFSSAASWRASSSSMIGMSSRIG